MSPRNEISDADSETEVCLKLPSLVLLLEKRPRKRETADGAGASVTSGNEMGMGSGVTADEEGIEGAESVGVEEIDEDLRLLVGNCGAISMLGLGDPDTAEGAGLALREAIAE